MKNKIWEITAEAGQAPFKWIFPSWRISSQKSNTSYFTAPINKESAKLAGYDDIGHQEIFPKDKLIHKKL
ncbi:MAG: hypothetical protein CM1200mP38_5310 [Dehalococcoidia bacterium]|nr:MAG: hypothetical protein CM1200mP38_5310 [Dehalococcoidia bacterium]